jgi:hypothetical protein
MFISAISIYKKLTSFPATFILYAFILASGCSNEVISPEQSAKIFQKGKCGGSPLFKDVSQDSCFSYYFGNTLSIDFCTTGNCCPDSNRFTCSYNFAEKQITIRIKDIAPNLCKCICKYTIHADFENLKYDEYLVNCFQEINNEDQLLYSKFVTRK